MEISKTEALNILQVSDVNEVEEAYEQLLFTWKQKYLGNMPPMLLVKAHIKKIERLTKAAAHFIPFENKVNQPVSSLNQQLQLIDYLQQYHQQIMQLKLQVSNTDNGYTLIELLNQYIAIQEALFSKLSCYAPEQANQHIDNIKISQPSDFYLAEKELIEKEIPETEILNYLRSQLAIKDAGVESPLLLEVLKAKKQTNSGSN
ncbi:MAG: hypothetical protein R3279_08070 [Putridiphycobacter sp.]|nr:hypothetical protein [Putridiphycobacter sp.]